MPTIAARLSYRRYAEDGDNSFTSLKKSVRSPSKRTKRGPLFYQDELSDFEGTSVNNTPLTYHVNGSDRSPRGYLLEDTVAL
jgi:hypothetical protein